MTAPPRPDFSDRSVDELEREIAETRARLGRDVDALAYRLSPAGLSEQVKGTLENTETLTLGAIGGLGESLLARSGAEGWGAQAGAFVRRYPVTTTLLGLGLAWLVMRSSGRR